MHRIWTVPELFHLILKQIPKSDQPDMGLVCKAFWPPTARVVWEVVPSIKDLLGLLPGDTQPSEHSRASKSKHGTRSGGWERFQFYAAFVRDLTANINRAAITSLQEFESSSQQTVLFPNLQRIRLDFVARVPRTGVEQVYTLLLPPNLKVLRCTYNFGLSPGDETAATIIQGLQSIPLIESFTFSGDMPAHISSRLGPALSSMPRLRS
ncbi:hypothetical protein FRB90_006319, partial [Tulasnella sp. 427]